MPARALNVVLGGWLFISAFLWSHANAQFTNTWVVGLVAFVVAVGSLALADLRFLNAAVGFWVVVSVFAIPTEYATVWNHLIVGGVMVWASLITPREQRRAPPPHNRLGRAAGHAP